MFASFAPEIEWRAAENSPAAKGSPYHGVDEVREGVFMLIGNEFPDLEMRHPEVLLHMTEFIDYLHEVFEFFGPITVRKMFGGYGIYHHGLMFGLVSDDTLYLKADAENANHFEKQGLGKFEYRKAGKVMKISYYLAPVEIMDDRGQAAIWARRSYEAALRAQRAKQKTKTTT